MDWTQRIRESQSRMEKAKGKSLTWVHIVAMPDEASHCSHCQGSKQLHKHEAVMSPVRQSHYNALGLAFVRIANRRTCLKCRQHASYCGGPHEILVPLWIAERGPKATLAHLKGH